MNYTTTVTATMDQHIRNTMSIMAWGMAALCAWIMLLSVHVLAADVRETVAKESYPTVSVSAPQK